MRDADNSLLPVRRGELATFRATTEQAGWVYALGFSGGRIMKVACLLVGEAAHISRLVRSIVIRRVVSSTLHMTAKHTAVRYGTKSYQDQFGSYV